MPQYYHDTHYHEQQHKHRWSAFFAWTFAVLGGVIVATLMARFALSLAGADRLTPLASGIYSASYPFVAPFFALFNYQPQQEILRFEYQTLLAMVFWSLLTWFVAYSIHIESTES